MNPFRFPHHKAVHGHFPGFRSPKDLDYQIDDIHRPDEAFLDLFSFEFFLEQVLVFPGGNLKLEIHRCFDQFPKGHGFRPAVRDNQHIDAEGVLQLRLFIEQI